MAKEKAGGEAGGAAGGGGGPALALPRECPFEGCKAKPVRAGFCGEHFLWFKAGIISRKGEKPRDFDKKFQAYQRRKVS